MDAGKIQISVFLDLSKAFDTFDSYILLGFGDNPWKWFYSNSMGMSQYVVFNGSHSNVMKFPPFSHRDLY